jgi:hypothetical protein
MHVLAACVYWQHAWDEARGQQQAMQVQLVMQAQRVMGEASFCFS